MFSMSPGCALENLEPCVLFSVELEHQDTKVSPIQISLILSPCFSRIYAQSAS